jgi:hypothetical protein
MLVRYVTMGEARAVTVEHLLAEGAKLLKAGHADQAIAVWTEVLHLAPGEPRALGYLKSIGVAANDVEEVLFAAGRPALADLEELLARKQYEEALEVLYAARREHPEATDLARGIQLLKQRLVRRYLRRLRNLDHIPHLLRLDEESLAVSEEARGIIHLVDGISSFGDIARESRLGRFETYRMLARMVEDSVITAAPAPHVAIATTMSHAPETTPPPRRRRGIYYVLLAAGVAAVAGGAVLVWRQVSNVPSAQPTVAAAATPARAPEPAAVPAPEPAPTPVPPVVTAAAPAPVPPPDAAPPVEAEPAPLAAAPEPVTGRGRPKGKLHAPAPTRASATLVPRPPASIPRAEASASAPAAAPAASTLAPTPTAAPPAAEPVRSEPPAVEAQAPKPEPIATPPKPSGPLDARVSASVQDVEGGLPRAMVERAVDRVLPAFRSCYAQAAAHAQKNVSGTLVVKFSLDETGVARDPDVGSGLFPDLAACVSSAARRIRTPPPDVGGARVTVIVTFSPLGP